jgi:hypothetical protein
MNRTSKILTVIFCVALCGGGAIFSLKETAKSGQPKTNVLPITNREPQRGVWIWA